MAHFAQIENNLVLRVIVVDNSDILDDKGNESEIVGSQFCSDLLDGVWVQTSYNGNIRKNFAGIGDTYDVDRDAFYSEKPYTSWLLDEELCQWRPPVDYPVVSEDSSVVYTWDEEAVIWIQATVNEEAEEA